MESASAFKVPNEKARLNAIGKLISIDERNREAFKNFNLFFNPIPEPGLNIFLVNHIFY